MERFLRWMRKNGIEYSDALDFRLGGDEVVYGTGVTALCDLKQEVLERAELGGGIGLAVAIMFERSRGKKSRWSPYLELLPQQESVPLVWSDQEIGDSLLGTELYQVIKQDRQFMREDWEEHILPLTEDDPASFPSEYFSFDCYLAAVSSRSFQVDEYHGHGMVPLADLFNHKTAAEDVHFMSTCAEDEDGGSEYSEQDIENLEMVLVKDVAKNSEIFNTYGQLGNAALLHRYGFTELDNPYDIVNIDVKLVLDALASRLSPERIHKRKRLWTKAGFQACGSEETQYFEIDRDGKPQVELLLLLVLMRCSTRACRKLRKLATKVNGSARRALKVLMKAQGFSSSTEACLPTRFVVNILMLALSKRAQQYGSKSSLKDDERRLKNGGLSGQAFQALSLRVAEKRILHRSKRLLKNRATEIFSLM